MKLKFVIAVRNGTNIFGLLTIAGITEVSKTAESIQKRVNCAKVKLLTSPRKYAVETARIIGVRLGIVHRCLDQLEHDVLGSGEPQMDAITKYADGCEVVIAIAHYVAPCAIINAFSQEYFGRKVYREEILHGCGLCLSLESSEVCYLP